MEQEQEKKYSDTQIAIRIAASMARMTAHLLVPAMVSAYIAKRVMVVKTYQLGIIFIGFIVSWCFIYLDYKLILKKKRK